jgi:hypothetical protein
LQKGKFPTEQLSLEFLAKQFEGFAEHTGRDASPLYERLSLAISTDAEMLALAAHAASGPVPNLFLGAVHFLLLREAESPLAAFYPSMTKMPRKDADPYPAFRSFCFNHAEEIQHLLQTRRVQTNEVRRCALLLPAFGIVAEQVHDRSLALVEIGASAGLNLLWDRYGYDYGTGRKYGNRDSPVQLSCRLLGDRQPPLPESLPRVASRLGIDLQPVDVHDSTAIEWLRALIWPEHSARLELLQRAVEVARQNTPGQAQGTVPTAGDALEVLPGSMASVPEETVLCIFHSFTINQFSSEGRKRLARLLDEYGMKRDLYCISIAAFRLEYPQLTLLSYQDGVKTERLLANCSSHGLWLEWLEPDGW